MGGRVSQKQGAVWASRQQPWELQQLISLITEVISHRPVRSFAFSASREGGGMYTQLNVYIGVQFGVTILSQVTAVFTLASFAPAQSIDQSWRLSGSANSDQSKHAERVTHDSYIQRVLVRRERTRTLVYIKRGLGGFSSSNSKRKRNAPEWETLPPTECHNLSPGGRHRPLPLQLSRIRDLIHRKCRCPTVRHQLAAEI